MQTFYKCGLRHENYFGFLSFLGKFVKAKYYKLMEVKERIIEGTCKIFMAEGIRRVTMDYLAKKMGVSKRTIYELFPDKQGLLRATLEFMFHRHDNHFNELAKSTSNTIEFVVGSIKVGVASIKEINPIFVDDLERHYPKLCHEFLIMRKRDTINEFQQLVDRGIREGMFRQGLNINLVAKIFVEQMELTHRKDIFPQDEYPAIELFETLVINFIRGICTLDGIRELEKLLESNQGLQS